VETPTVTEVILLVEVQEETDAEFLLSYVVSGASWSASYDARVHSVNKTLEITYYGTIINGTKEDWNDVKISLSTAKPSTGGTPPELFTSHVRYKQYFYGDVEMDFKSTNRKVQDFHRSNILFDLGSNSAPQMNRSMQVMTTVSTESTSSTTFTIPRSATIICDSKPRKVVINIIKLDSTFVYTIVPKINPIAYLKAKIINTTDDITFLPGEVNVFMDENFVTKSSLPLVFPSQTFSLGLGVDDGIKVEYLPVKRHTDDTTGFFTKSKILSVSHETKISNKKTYIIDVQLFDQLPKSEISDIKVKMLEPIIEEDQEIISITPENNVEWRFSLKPDESQSIRFSYTIEYPKDENQIQII